MSLMLNVILSHQPPAAVEKMTAWWGRCVPSDSILIAYGGGKVAFEGVIHKQKFFIDDLRLRTRDHQREFQSYNGLFQGAARFLHTCDRNFDFVYFAEYDHLPLVP